jgi:hypothetical protein
MPTIAQRERAAARSPTAGSRRTRRIAAAIRAPRLSSSLAVASAIILIRQLGPTVAFAALATTLARAFSRPRRTLKTTTPESETLCVLDSGLQFVLSNDLDIPFILSTFE